MSSSDDQIIQSVDNIISAVEKLVEDIRVAPDIQVDSKNYALLKVGSVAQDLDLINRAIFLNEFPDDNELVGHEAEPEALTEAGDVSVNEMISSWSDNSDAVGSSKDQPDLTEVAETAPPKPRIVVTPVKQSIAKDVPVVSEDNSGEEDNIEKEIEDVSVSSSFESSMKSALSKEMDEVADDEPQVVSDSVLETDPELELAVESVSEDIDEVEPAPVQADELIFIDGIDEDVALILTKYGILTYHDIAAFKEADMLRLSEELNDPCRVSRQNWIEQAALLEKNVSTYYAKKLRNEVEFDRLSLLSVYSALPLNEPVLEDVLAEPELADSDDFSESVAYSEDVISDELVAKILGSDASELAGVDLNARREDISYERDLEQEDVSDEAFVEGGDEIHNDLQVPMGFVTPPQSQDIVEDATAELVHPEEQEITDVLLAKKQALEAELALLTAQMIKENETGEDGVGSEQSTQFASNEALLNSSAIDSENQDNEAFFEEKIVISQEAEVLTHVVGQNELSELAGIHSANQFDTSSEEVSLGDGAIWHEEVSTAKDYIPPVIDDDEDLHSEYQEQDESYSERIEEPLDRGDGAFDSDSFVLSSQAVQGGGYDYDVNDLSEHAPSGHMSQLEGFQQDYHSEQEVALSSNFVQSESAYFEAPGKVKSESPDLPPVPVSSVEMAPELSDATSDMRSLSQAPMVNDIGDLPNYIDDGISIPSSETERAIIPDTAFASSATLGPLESVSDKIPDIKEKIGDGNTLGQYLASKTNGEETLAFDGQEALQVDSGFRAEQNKAEYIDILEDQTSFLSQVPPQDLPPRLPPLMTPAFTNGMPNGGHVDEARSQLDMPPTPPPFVAPASTQPHAMLPPASPPALPVLPAPPAVTEVPLPPQHRSNSIANNEMPVGQNGSFAEGQAYADTQRIIAEKRRADAARAMNRSQIQQGQAYADTQRLMDSDITGQVEHLHDLPPLPPEGTMGGAFSQPQNFGQNTSQNVGGQNQTELQYRGVRPPQTQEIRVSNLPPENYPPHSDGDRGGMDKPVASSGFRAKAKQLAESLQKSFVDKD